MFCSLFAAAPRSAPSNGKRAPHPVAAGPKLESRPHCLKFVKPHATKSDSANDHDLGNADRKPGTRGGTSVFVAVLLRCVLLCWYKVARGHGVERGLSWGEAMFAYQLTATFEILIMNQEVGHGPRSLCNVGYDGIYGLMRCSMQFRSNTQCFADIFSGTVQHKWPRTKDSSSGTVTS